MRLPRTLIITLEYPPRPYGASLLLYRQLADLSRLAGYERGTKEVWARVVAPWPSRPDLAPLDPPPGVEVRYFPDYTRPVVRLPYFAVMAWWHSRDFTADVIYANQYRAFGPIIRRMAKRRGIEYVSYFHGTEIKTELGRPSREKILKHYAQSAYRCLTNSDDSLKLVEEELSPLARPAVRLSPAIDPGPYDKARFQRERIRGALGVGQSPRLVLLAAARMDWNKNLVALLWALDEMRQIDATSDPTSYIDLWLAGDGPERAPLAAKARELGMIVEEPDPQEVTNLLENDEHADPLIPHSHRGPRIIFLGFPSPHLLPYLVSAADAVVSSSNYESFGMTFLEAAAAGLPALAPNVGGVSTIVQDGTTGILTLTNSSSDLATGLERLMEIGRDGRKEMGGAARRRCEAEFSPSVAAEQLASILNEAAAARASR